MPRVKASRQSLLQRSRRDSSQVRDCDDRARTPRMRRYSGRNAILRAAKQPATYRFQSGLPDFDLIVVISPVSKLTFLTAD